MIARSLSSALLLALALLAGGCASVDPRIGDLVGPVHTPSNVRGPARWPENLARVAVLPAHDTSGRLPAPFVDSYDGIWRRSLDRSQRAEFISITRPELSTWTGRASLGTARPVPRELLPRIGRETGAQAVLFLELNHCTPYPPLVISFRARLVAIDSGETVWMADEIFDAADDATARSARRHARANTTGPGDTTGGILHSPSQFSEYAFLAVTNLLPPRTPPAGKTP
jgi:hypothetical protein